MKERIDAEKFQTVLFGICGKETSSDPENWTPENPLYGHCAVVALLVQDLYGGQLLRASLENTEFAYMRSHYWNRLPDGTGVDFTKPQFGNRYPVNLKPEIREREYLISNPETLKRYQLLRSRFDAIWSALTQSGAR